MQAVILCGGRGERLMPLTACRPAALLRITGDTILNYALHQLKNAGFQKVVLALGYLEGMIISEIDSCDFDGMKVKFLSSEESGTAGSLAQAFDGDDMMVIEANCIFNFNLKKIQAFHTINKALCTVVTKRFPNLSDHTCFSTDDEGRIVSVSQNPANDNISAANAFSGVYVLSKEAFSQFPFSNGSDFVSDILPLMTSNQKLLSYEEKGYWCKITDASGFIQAQHDMLNGKTGLEIKAASSENGIFTHTISNFNGISIIPPVYIGENVTIEKGSVIEPCSVIDDNAVIGSRVRISGSYIGPNAVVSARSELTETVVCHNALIKKSVHCGEHSVIGEKAIIRDGARIEDNIKIWAGKEVAPNSVISRHIIVGSGKSINFDDCGEFNFGTALNAPADFAKMGMATGTAFDKGNIILVGHSDNNASQSLTECFISGLISTGVKVFYMGKCTNQQIMYCTTRFSCNAGCFISADYEEKIKITDKGGLPLKRSVERKIETSYNNSSFRLLDCHQYGKRYDLSGGKALYEIYLDGMLPSKFTGINAEIRSSSRETAYLADELFHEKNDIDGEKIIFHVSADGSSCSAYTDKTGYIFHERLILLAMKSCYKRDISVSVPFSFPMGADALAESEGKHLLRYYNSPDDNSDKTARETAQRADNLFIRDALALICTICSYLSDNDLTLRDAMKDIPRFSSIQRFVSIKGNAAEIIDTFTTEKAGGNEGIVLQKENTRAIIRPIKNGGGLMIFAESFKSEEASAICDEIQDKLRKYENNVNS